MSEAAKTITVDGVEYRQVAAPSEVRIVVLRHAARQRRSHSA